MAITSDYHKEYTPGWDEACKQLYEEFMKERELEIADELLHSLDAAACHFRGTETVESLNFQTSSKEARSL